MQAKILNFSSLDLNHPDHLLSQIEIEFEQYHLALHERKRQQLYSCDNFEIVLMHWGPESSTVLHGHGGSDCYMKILTGSILEKRYRPFTDSLMEENKLELGMDTFICDDESFHTLHSSASSVSLHIYSKPLAYLQVLDSSSKNWEHRAPQIF